jgi:hypothetical protein
LAVGSLAHLCALHVQTADSIIVPALRALQVMMQQDSEGLAAQQAAETARREAGKLGMQVLKQQMQVRGNPRDQSA